MKGNELWTALLLGLLVPVVLYRVFTWAHPLQREQEETKGTEVVVQTEPPKKEERLCVLQADGAVADMALEEYLVGVLLGEMPTGFEEEAMKAQAVAARTVAVKSRKAGQKHPTADVCIQPGCCQAYCSQSEFLEKGGTQEAVDKVCTAVMATAGQVLTYEGNLIEATYFSCSGGRTEDAVAVWGTEIPYLKAQDSPGEESAAPYTDTVQFDLDTFAEQLGIASEPRDKISVEAVTYTRGGGVDTIKIAGHSFSGMQMREKLKLRSTAFVLRIVGQRVTITTKGFGHRVGMSQYGAEAMAAKGSGYRDILSYYYPGAVITNL